MRDYLKLFDEIVEIMHHDYAGKDEKVGWDQPDSFRDKVSKLIDSKNLDDESFYKLVDDYLADFKDGHLIWFPIVIPLKNSGFRVRRYENSLYVTKVLVDEINVKEGWRIIEIDGIDIETLGK